MKGFNTVRAVMAEYRFSEEHFFRSRLHVHREARIEAIKRLKSDGLNNGEIALVMGIDVSTVRYWLSPAMRNRTISRLRAYRGGVSGSRSGHDDPRWAKAIERGAVIV